MEMYSTQAGVLNTPDQKMQEEKVLKIRLKISKEATKETLHFLTEDKL